MNSSNYVVIKLGGHALAEAATAATLDALAEDLISLRSEGVRPLVVHGAGPQINASLTAQGLATTFSGGLRVTDSATMMVVSSSLHHVNVQLVAGLNARHVPAWGVGGADGRLLTARARGAEWGRTGGEVRVATEILTVMAERDFVPVISPVAVDESGELLNCNADEVAGAITKALCARALVLLSDVDQVRTDPGDPASAVSRLNHDDIASLRAAGAVRDGMGPKLDAAQAAVRAGAERVVIANGTRPHALSDVLHGIGSYTEVTA